MRRVILALLVWSALLVSPAVAQYSTREAEIKQAAPYARMLRENPDLTLEDYNQAVRDLAREQERNDLLQPSVPTTPYRYAPRYTAPVPQYSTPEPSSGTSYDWRSGNSYRWHRNYDGSTQVDGTNLNTGSTWQTRIKPDGSMRGTDSKFNPWTYDSRTKTYMNYGTGQMCTGEGYARVCTP